MSVADLGEAAWTARDLEPVLLNRRLMLAARAAELRKDGLLNREIAAELGVSASYASELILDPTGEQSKKRKERYAQPCVDCGDPTSGSEGWREEPRCVKCATAKVNEERAWSDDELIDALHRAAAILGRPPTVVDLVRATPMRRKMSATRIAEAKPLDDARDRGEIVTPAVNTYVAHFGSWNAALVAAGFPSGRSGGEPSHREQAQRKDLWTIEKIIPVVVRMREMLGRPLMSEDFRQPQRGSIRRRAERERMRAELPRVPSYELLRDRFGSIDHLNELIETWSLDARDLTRDLLARSA